PFVPPVFDEADFGPPPMPPDIIRLPIAAPAPAAAPPARAGIAPPPPGLPGPTDVSVNFSTIFVTASSMALTIDLRVRIAMIVNMIVKTIAASVMITATKPDEDR